jgi:PAS domain S-box-containing protein
MSPSAENAKRKRAQQTLRTSEIRYRRLFEAAQDGILLVDPRTRKIEDANPYMTKLLGYPHQDFVGKELWEIGLLRDEDASRAAFQELQEKGFIRYDDLPLRTTQGERRDVEFVSNVYEEADHSIIQCNIRDITQRKRMEAEREVSHARERAARKEAEALRSRFRALFESTPGLYAVLLPEAPYRIEGASDAYLRATMTERSEIVGRGYFEVFPADPADPEADGSRNLAASLERVRQNRVADVMAVQRYPIRRPPSKGGGFEERYWSPVNSPMFGPEGELVYIIHRVEDVTEFIRLKQHEGTSEAGRRLLESRAVHMEADIVMRARELQKANEHLRTSEKELHHARENLEALVAERTAKLQASMAELEAFSYSLSHDMRAPLRTIRSFTEIVLAEAGKKLGASETDLLKTVIGSADRLDRLIQDVLTLTRLSRQEIHPEVVDTQRLVQEIIHERPEFQPPKAEIKINPPLPPVLGQKASLTQCITNLLANAVKFVPRGVKPRVQIASESNNGQVRLWFEDNGIGIEPAAQGRIFEMFQRNHHDADYEGTGIGLTIVRKAVERMGGTVGVESELGRGSRFWLQLPCARL